MKTIETARLQLKPLSPRHADALYSIYSEPAVGRFLISRPESRQEFDAMFARALDWSRTHGMWAVCHKPGLGLIGRVGFLPFGETTRPELAFLLSECFWGRGLATEACVACLTYGFEERCWPEIVAVVRPENHAAIRVVTKLGMSTEGPITLGGAPAVVYQVDRATRVRSAAVDAGSPPGVRIRIRPVVEDDATAVASLLSELGYPTH